MSWLPGLGLVNSSPASGLTETRVVPTPSTVMVCPTLAIVPVELGVFFDEIVVEIVPVVTDFEACEASATTPMHPSTTTASTPRTIQSQVLRLFFGDCPGGG